MAQTAIAAGQSSIGVSEDENEISKKMVDLLLAERRKQALAKASRRRNGRRAIVLRESDEHYSLLGMPLYK